MCRSACVEQCSLNVVSDTPELAASIGHLLHEQRVGEKFLQKWNAEKAVVAVRALVGMLHGFLHAWCCVD